MNFFSNGNSKKAGHALVVLAQFMMFWPAYQIYMYSAVSNNDWFKASALLMALSVVCVCIYVVVNYVAPVFGRWHQVCICALATVLFSWLSNDMGLVPNWWFGSALVLVIIGAVTNLTHLLPLSTTSSTKDGVTTKRVNVD